jgi:uncharacterized protein involved in tolerance to divalent cations
MDDCVMIIAGFPTEDDAHSAVHAAVADEAAARARLLGKRLTTWRGPDGKTTEQFEWTAAFETVILKRGDVAGLIRRYHGNADTAACASVRNGDSDYQTWVHNATGT